MGPLPLFSPIHIIILVVIMHFWFFVPKIGEHLDKEVAQNFAIKLAFLSIFLEVYLFIYRVSNGIFNPINNFPLHLCSFAEYSVAYALITKNQRAFELAFYWGFAGTMQALITPHLTGYSLFDTQFIIFFVSHGLIIMNVFWLLNVDKMKIRSNSLFEAMIATNILAIPIGIIDWLTGANYLYLRYKPPVDNPLLIGEWPWYIIGFQVISVVLYSILFLIMKLVGKVKYSKSTLTV